MFLRMTGKRDERERHRKLLLMLFSLDQTARPKAVFHLMRVDLNRLVLK